MSVTEAITAVLTASHHGDHHFRNFLKGDDPEVVAMRKALVMLADAVRDADGESLPVEVYGSGECPICENYSSALLWVHGHTDTIQCRDCLDEP